MYNINILKLNTILFLSFKFLRIILKNKLNNDLLLLLLLSINDDFILNTLIRFQILEFSFKTKINYLITH